MDEYREIDVIRTGSFGTVHLCERKSDNEKVALKIIPLKLERTNDIQDVKSEISILSSLDHINIIKYYDSFVLNNEKAVIVMEYATSGTLNNFVRQNTDQVIPQDKIMMIFAQLCLAMEYIHDRNIIHRDITASNVLLTGLSNDVVKLSDFGLSEHVKSRKNSINDLMSMSSSSSEEMAAKASSVNVIGTVEYMAPEVCCGKPYTKASDVWSLGCLLYFMITRQLPFPSCALLALVKKIIGSPPDLTIIDRTEYDEEIIDVIHNLLNKESPSRWKIEVIIAHPAVLRYIILVGTNPPLVCI